MTQQTPTRKAMIRKSNIAIRTFFKKPTIPTNPCTRRATTIIKNKRFFITFLRLLNNFYHLRRNNPEFKWGISERNNFNKIFRKIFIRAHLEGILQIIVHYHDYDKSMRNAKMRLRQNHEAFLKYPFQYALK